MYHWLSFNIEETMLTEVFTGTGNVSLESIYTLMVVVRVVVHILLETDLIAIVFMLTKSLKNKSLNLWELLKLV